MLPLMSALTGENAVVLSVSAGTSVKVSKGKNETAKTREIGEGMEGKKTRQRYVTCQRKVQPHDKRPKTQQSVCHHLQSKLCPQT